MNEEVIKVLETIEPEEIKTVMQWLAQRIPKDPTIASFNPADLVVPVLDESCIKPNGRFFDYYKMLDRFQEVNPHINLSVEDIKLWKKYARIVLDDLRVVGEGQPLKEINTESIAKAFEISNGQWQPATSKLREIAHVKILYPKNGLYSPTREGISYGVPNEKLPYAGNFQHPAYDPLTEDVALTLKTQLKERHLDPVNDNYRMAAINLEVFHTFGVFPQIEAKHLMPKYRIPRSSN